MKVKYTSSITTQYIFINSKHKTFFGRRWPSSGINSSNTQNTLYIIWVFHDLWTSLQEVIS